MLPKRKVLTKKGKDKAVVLFANKSNEKNKTNNSGLTNV